MTHRPRESRALHPVPLVAQRLLKLCIQDAMIDHMVRQHDDATAFGDEPAKHEVIRVVISQLLEAADLINTAVPHGHESHALQHFGHEHAGSHLHGHSQPFQSCPNSALRGYAAIDTGDQSGLFLPERIHHRAQISRLDAHVTIRNHQNVVPCCGFHLIQRKTPRIGPRRLSGSHDPNRHARIFF